MSSIFTVLVMLGLLVQPAHAGEIGPALGRFVWYDLAGEAPGRSEPARLFGQGTGAGCDQAAVGDGSSKAGTPLSRALGERQLK